MISGKISCKSWCIFTATLLIFSTSFVSVFSVSASDKACQFYIIEFAENPSIAKRGQLAMNMNFHRYLGSGKYICEIPSNFIRSVLYDKSIIDFKQIEPEDKISSNLKHVDEELKIILSTYDIKDVDSVVQIINRLGGAVTDVQDVGVSRIWATVPSAMITDIVNIPEVFFIEQESEAITFMDKITTTTYMGMDAAQTGGFTGSGIMGEVQDDGCELSHPDFSVDYYDGGISTQTHGTCTYGIAFSLGTNNIETQGTLYDAISVFADYGDNTQYNSVSHLWNGQFTSGNAGQNGLFQSNSWGHLPWPSGYGGYNSYTAESDQASYDYPKVLVLWAAANSNNGVQKGSLSYESQAKNGLTVGAVWHKDTASMSDDEWLNGGAGNTPSQGPCPDGRQKPDVVGPFDYIYCSDITGSGGYASGDYYYNFGGTSGSTPAVAGIVGQTYEMYIENHFGNNPSGTIPSSALVKAIVIADAYQYSLADADRDSQGWGSADAEQIYTLGSTYHVMDDGISVSPGGSWSRTVTSDGTMPLKITLVWNDPAAPESTGSNRALMNNLDLKVTTPDGTTEWWGNNGLYSNHWSTSGTGVNHWTRNSDYRDDENNVENVFIQNPSSETYTIEVFGRSGDMYSGSQDFAVVASGAQNVMYNPPIIQMITPDGGEIIQAGTSYDITWSTTPGDGTITGVDLEYSTDNGGSWNAIITGTTDDGSYTWDVPDDPSTQCLVRGTVHDDNDLTDTDISDGSFEIVGITPGPPSNLLVQHYGAISVQDSATSFSTTYSEPTINDYTATHTSNDISHIISEDNRVQGGSGKAALDITYNIPISLGTVAPYTLYLESYKVDNDDSYTVSYTINGGGGETSIITIPSSESALSYTISGASAGDTVNINIKDSVMNPREDVGTVYIDHLYIESGGGGGGTDDNKLIWDASIDDGTGADDVIHYNVYQKDTIEGSWIYIDLVNADASSSYSYIDAGKGTADNTQWYYVVTAVDAGGSESAHSNEAQEPSEENHAPNTPSSPYPADEETNVELSPTLSVVVTDPDGDSMDVTFYDASDDSIIGTDMGVASGGPAQIQWTDANLYETTYFWYTIADDGQYQTRGPTTGSWSFTTITEPVNNPPNTPMNPNPTDIATGVSVVTDLSWTGGDPDSGDTVEYDVYFGTSATPPHVATVTVESYDPGTLTYQTMYYWQIVARDNQGAETTGPVWSFTTENEPVGVTIDSIIPDNMQSGTTISVTIYGSGFETGADVTFENGAGPNPTTSNILIVDSDTITCDLYAKSGGPPRPRIWDVRVTNPDSSTDVLIDGFTVYP